MNFSITTLTSKHHEGLTFFDTKKGDLSVVQKTPAGQDLVNPFEKALEREVIKDCMIRFSTGLIPIIPARLLRNGYKDNSLGCCSPNRS